MGVYWNPGRGSLDTGFCMTEKLSHKSPLPSFPGIFSLLTFCPLTAVFGPLSSALQQLLLLFLHHLSPSQVAKPGLLQVGPQGAVTGMQDVHGQLVAQAVRQGP